MDRPAPTRTGPPANTRALLLARYARALLSKHGFSRVYSANPLCAPARTAMMTGREQARASARERECTARARVESARDKHARSALAENAHSESA